ncbi:P-loop containing nucleoside triphosphate hydrolase protein [Dioscorea alata]|uniref:P-loop containing nucleoside triphosphate hydrolase protein n=1 Tax=Dioscorea alata TaxID=55571 RepID=A0ACB7VSZ3_DIOAL|nr:P-loop containing nucleoside triphosphate hydrolase protein [Dioscorea alata]
MAEVVLSALIKLVCEKVASKVLKELGALAGVEKEFKRLENTLLTIQDVLEDAEARQVKEKALKRWLRKLKDVAFDMDDVLDEFMAKAEKLKMEKDMKAKLGNLVSAPKFRYKMADKMKEIMKRFDEISEERSKFDLREGAVKEEIGEREETGSFVNESEVYGRDEDREKLVDFLTNSLSSSSSSSSEANPDVMAIVGLGGLGKTTLAQLVFNDERVCQHFRERIWVCVSDEFDGKRLTRSIIESMTGSECNLKDMHSLQRILREKLRGERFLLVLDDVWNEDHEKWDRLRALLTGCAARGSKVIVTTRSARVASIMGTISPHLLTGLSDQDCWVLFEKRAFGIGGAVKTPNLVAIGKDIVSKCAGLPLAAKALGSLMRFRRGEREWVAVKDNEIWRLPEHENQILPSLRLSYNHLPSCLKPCFAYCSIFPKNYQMRKETLVQLWMAEGFLTHDYNSFETEVIGNGYVDELLERSLFQNGDEDTDGVVRQVKMHDLVHDLAHSVAGDEGSVADEASGYASRQGCRYLSFVYDRPISESKPPPFLNEANKLRSFYFIAEGNMKYLEQSQGRVFRLDAEGDMKEADDNKEKPSKPAELSDIFSTLKLLRALHLNRYPLMREIPVLIGKMKHLRYLNLSNTIIEVVPPCVGLLHNLQTLNISCCRWLRMLPDSFGQLTNLSTLHLEGCSSLQSLPGSIGCLKNLRKLDLSLSQYVQALPESLSRLSNLQDLRLRHCYSMRELPVKMKDMKSLIHLDITSCVELTCIPAGIGQLRSLRTLPIFIVGGKTNCSLKELGSLSIEGQLHIKHLENVTNPHEAKEANLKEKQGLRSLRLSWDKNVYRTPGQSSDDNLSDDEESRSYVIDFLLLHNMVPEADLVDDVLENLQPDTYISELEIEGYVGKKYPTWMMDLSLLPNLVDLTLDSCIRCETLPPMGQLPHLKALRLRLLCAIRCIDSSFYGGHAAFPVLEELVISMMFMLQEWSGTSEGELFPSLTKLTLGSCPLLRELPSNFPSVKHLNMNMEDELLLSNLQEGAFPNLMHLHVREYDEDCIPEVISRLMESVESYSVQSKLRPKDDDPSAMPFLCFSKYTVYAGTTSLPLFPAPIWF